LKNNHIKIGDFGEAKQLSENVKAITRERGTDSYKSPEAILLQYKSENNIEISEVTFKTDIW